MALWNQRNLNAPVVLNGSVKSKHIKEEICALIKTSENMLNYYATLSTFEKAAAYHSRFCNRWKNRLRNMHGFQVMRRLNQMLIRFKNMDLVRIAMDFHSFLPETSYIEREVNLPVRSNLEHLLVKMQGLGKMLLRVVYLTKEAARYHLKQIANGFLYHMYSMFLALAAELWLFARSVCKRTVQFYDELYPALVILPVSKKKWLPEGYELPASLAAWLGEEYEREIMCTGSANQALELGVNSNIFTLLQHKTKDEEENLLAQMETAINMDDEDKLSRPSFSSVPKSMLLQSLRSDTGEVVQRVERTAAQQFDVSKLNHIRSKFHVQQFLLQERAKRTDSSAEAITHGVSEHHFGDFNVRLMMKFNQLSSAEFVKYFKEQLQQLIQMDA
uniref:Nucleolus and neural progenitor protein-like N-terminal domain-containing protein n=1 Tax=Anopheles minimus TaxID=112268 RepID=A0A182VRH8_9DIPT